jgi:ABC-2 type transport system permease protein
VPAWVLIAGRALVAIVVALAVMTVLLLIGRFAYGVRLPARTLPAVVLTGIVGAIAFCCLGYALSTAIRSADSAQPMVQAIMLPLYFISGVFIPNVSLPHWLRDVAKVFPVQHLAGGLRHAFDPATRGAGIVWSDLGVLVVWAALGLVVALTRFASRFHVACVTADASTSASACVVIARARGAATRSRRDRASAASPPRGRDRTARRWA